MYILFSTKYTLHCELECLQFFMVAAGVERFIFGISDVHLAICSNKRIANKSFFWNIDVFYKKKTKFPKKFTNFFFMKRICGKEAYGFSSFKFFVLRGFE